jgi:hypothetical protein
MNARLRELLVRSVPPKTRSWLRQHLPVWLGGIRREKVFGIGLPKTGTKSLAVALLKLGYYHSWRSWWLMQPVMSVLDHRHLCSDEERQRALESADLGALFEHARRYESFEDNPWCYFYRELDATFPGSKFILTLRQDVAAWVRSVESQRRRYRHTYALDLEQARRFYREHELSVRAYFRDRPRDLLVVCWEQGDGWPELCTFLGRPLPDAPFPHANATPAETQSSEDHKRRSRADFG